MATATFTIPWVSAARFSIRFKTEIDSEYTAHEQRNALKSDPQYRWSLKVQRNKTNFAALQAFFIARKARWNAFNFVWAADRGGDDQTYLVRLDHSEDELVFAEDDRFWIVSIVQVVS